MSGPAPESRGRSRQPGFLWLLAGAATGTLLAAAGLLGTAPLPPGVVPPGAVARVNDRLIRLEDYQRALNGVAQDRRSGVDEELQRHVRDRLIDEELLLQRALELGLAHEDVRARRALVTAVIESVVASEDQVNADEAELRAFYERERDFFTSPAQLRLRQIWVAAGTPGETIDAERRARQAASRWKAGESLSSLRSELGDEEAVPLPDALLPVAKISDLLGPTVLRTVLLQPVGEVGDVIRSSRGFHVLQVVERTRGEPPEFENIRSQVLAEFRRRASDQALRTYLDELRSRAMVTVSPDLP